MKTAKQLLFVALIGLLMVSVAMAQEKASQTATPGPTIISSGQVPDHSTGWRI